MRHRTQKGMWHRQFFGRGGSVCKLCGTDPEGRGRKPSFTYHNAHHRTGEFSVQHLNSGSWSDAKS